MFSSTAIDRATVQAYLETEYRASPPDVAILRIGERNNALAGLHR